MKILILYDSMYGNTELIAKAIADVFEDSTVKKIHYKEIPQFSTYDLIIIGSPTHGGRPSAAMQVFISSILDSSLKGINIATFDTRFATQDHGVGLRILMNVIHFASEKLARTLKKKGAVIIGKPEGFIVEDKKGPLKKGELIRAKEWGSSLIDKIKN